MPDRNATKDGSVGRSGTVFLRDGLEFDRIVNLTDATVAIALTILVLTLDVPAPAGDASTANMGEVLRDLGPPMFALVLSFVIIAVGWYHHHRFIAALAGLDGPMVVWNFAWLLILVLVPFGSDLIGTYGSNPGGVAIYAALMGTFQLVGGLGYGLAQRRHLSAEHLSPTQRRARVVDNGIGVACFYASIPATLATQEPAVGFWIWAAIWPLNAISGRYLRRVGADAS